jgi:hypothetical protein
MNKKLFIKSTIVFICFTLAGVGMIVFGLSAAQPQAQSVLPLAGTSLFTAGLTFFLVEAFKLMEQIKQ